MGPYYVDEIPMAVALDVPVDSIGGQAAETNVAMTRAQTVSNALNISGRCGQPRRPGLSAHSRQYRAFDAAAQLRGIRGDDGTAAGAEVADERPSLDFWAYFDTLSRSEWEGHDFAAGTVSYTCFMPGNRWEHVLVESEDKNANLVLVLDLDRLLVLGHYLLDFDPRCAGDR